MPKPTAKPYQIRRRDQIAALTSPVRQEMLDALVASGPCSISELAGLLGRAPDALYYHIRKLERVGLLVPGGTAKAGRRDAALYDVPGRPMTIDEKSIDAGTRPLVIKSTAALLRSTERDLAAAIASNEDFGTGRRRRLVAGRIKGGLTTRDVEEVNRHISAIADIFERSRAHPGRRLFTMTYALVPARH